MVQNCTVTDLLVIPVIQGSKEILFFFYKIIYCSDKPKEVKGKVDFMGI